MDLFDRPAWQARAACRGLDTDLFFTDRGESTAAAKAVCAGCNVRSECLAYAQAKAERFGIWGGLSERQRRRIRDGKIAPRTCQWAACQGTFAPVNGAQVYCRAEHQLAAAGARKTQAARKAG